VLAGLALLAAIAAAGGNLTLIGQTPSTLAAGVSGLAGR
jgi:hypothetical protein